MSGQAIGTGVGFIAGFFLPGGPSVWASVGGMIGGAIDPTVVKSQGPRLDQATVQTAQVGGPITVGWGTFTTAGNILWRGPLVEDVIKERTRPGKGSGQVQESTTYVYTRDFAIAICEAPIVGLLMVKENGKIVYDARTDEELAAVGYDAGAIAASRAASAAFMQNAKVYTGGPTQMPDPVIEGHEGVGNVSGYRHLAYIRFQGKDCTDMRGAISTFEFVVNGDGSTAVTPGPDPALLFHYPLDDAAPGGVARELVGGYNGHYSADHVGSGPALSAGGGGSAFFNDFGAYMICSLTNGDSNPPDMNRSEWSVSVWFQNTASTNPDPNDQGSTQKVIAMYSNGNWPAGEANFNLTLKQPTSPPEEKNRRPTGSWTTGGGSGTVAIQGSDIIGMYRTCYMVMTYKANPAYGSNRGDAHLYVNGALVDTQNNVPAATTTGDGLMVGGGFNFPSSWQFFGYVADLKGYGRELTSTEIIATYANSALEWIENPDAPGTYTNANGDIVHYSATAITRNRPTVGSIIAAIALRNGLQASDIDVSEMTDPIDGFRIASDGGGDVFIAPLLQYAMADAGEWDGKLRFKKRGGAMQLAITADDLARRDGDAIEQILVQEAELPKKVTGSYIDPLATYSPATQTWERAASTVRAKGEMSIEFPLVASGVTIAQNVEKIGKVTWSETIDYKFSLPSKFSRLTPTDIIHLTDKKNVTHRVRAVSVESEKGVILVEAKRDRQAAVLATAAAVAPVINTPTPPNVRGPTMIVAFNAPPLNSDETSPGIRVAVRGLSGGWSGCNLYISADDGDSETFAGTLTNAATIGWLTANITSSPSDVIKTQLYGGAEIDSITDAQLAARQGAWAIVTAGMAEIGQSKTSTMVPGTFANTFELTDNLRGQLGTVATSHFQDDRFVVLDEAVYFIPIDYSLAGKTLRIRPASLGTVAANNPYIELVYNPPEILWDGNGDDPPAPPGPTPPSGGTGSSSSGLIAITIGATTVNVDSYGAVGNGITDDTAAFAAAFAALPVGGGTVQCTPGKTYLVDPEYQDADPDDSDRCGIKMLNNTRLDINGATIKRKVTNNDFRHTIFVYEKHDVEIKGGTIIGDRDDPSWSGPTSTDTKEHGHNIAVYGSDKVIIKNLTTKKATGDGISIGRRLSSFQSTNCYVWDVISTQNRRQGLSIGRSNVVKVKGSEFSYTSGTSPQAGIDVEPDNPATQQSTNTTITSCWCHHNKGPGIQLYKSANTAIVELCTLEDNNRGLYAIDADNGIARDNIIRRNLNDGIYLKATSSGWSIGGVGDENDFFSNLTYKYGTHTTGASTTVTGVSAVTAKHLRIDSTASATVGANKYGPT